MLVYSRAGSLSSDMMVWAAWAVRSVGSDN